MFMDFSRVPIRNWFGYTRRERRATFILLLIILVVTGVRYIFPVKNSSIEELSASFAYASDKSDADNGVMTESQEQWGVFRYDQQQQLLDINTCDSAALEALPGIGPVLSVRIIKFRNLLGGYVSVSQLREVYGLNEETYEMIAGRIFADTLKVRKIKINRAEYKDLIRLPYFDRYEITAILKYRELKGSITGMRDLTENKLVAVEKSDKIKPYLDFGE